MAASWSSRRSVTGQPALRQLRHALDLITRISPISRFVVADESMLPAYRPGDRVVVTRVPYLLRSPRSGDVIVIRDPGHPERRLLKRVGGVTQDGHVDVRGDNAAVSRDSGRFGPVARRSIVGKVWFKY